MTAILRKLQICGAERAMAYWEFLLQKEGDRDWLPLETAHVEISEGRYRIIAHTSYCDTPVSIRLSRLLTESMPPQRKTLRRVGATNANGLMVVMPFTHLTPGQWTITCRSAADSDAESWEFGVQLQVLAIESGMEYWDTDLDEAAFADQLIDNAAPATTDDPWSPPAPEWEANRTTADSAFATPTAIADLPLRLQLQHQALVAQTAAPLTLQGQVTTFSQVDGLAGEGTLWVQLRNPETGKVVYQATQAISIAALPSRFEVAISLPAESSTRLLVGELSLWTASEPPQILAIQGFTVTLNLDALLELVANQAESTATNFEDLTPSSTAAADADSEAPTSPATGADRMAADAIAPPLSPRSVPFRLVYLPSSGLTLPPVIYRPIDKKTVGAPSLPSLSPNQRDRAQSAPSSPTAGDPPSTPAAKPLTLPPIGSSASAPPAAKPPSPSPSASSLELPAVGPPPNPAAPDTPEPPTPDDAAATAAAPATFEPDLQGRFWNRLSALAEEAQKAAADYQAQLEAAGINATDPAVAEALQGGPAIADAPTDAPINYEVVVYDDDAESPAPSLSDAAEAAPREPLVEVLQPGEPDRQELGAIPQPDWVFPQGALVAGAPLPITIRLPAYPRRLAVKVWVTDIQSRTLVDRPRWLMNWTPTPEGDQTAFLQLQVPLGSIEARFEAITIDLATQQESYKTSTVREILPADPADPTADDPL